MSAAAPKAPRVGNASPSACQVEPLLGRDELTLFAGDSPTLQRVISEDFLLAMDFQGQAMAFRDVRQHMNATCLTSRAEGDRVATGKTSVVEATFTMSSFFHNFGTLSMPFVFAQSGLASLWVLILAVILCSFTGYLLGQVLQELVDSDVLRPGYGDMATRVAGPRFGFFVQLLAPIECFVYALGNCVVMSKTLTEVFPQVDIGVLVSMSCALAVLQCAIPDKVYAYLSLFSTAALMGIMVVVLNYGAGLPEWSADLELVIDHGIKLPKSFSLTVFCIAAHCCFPMLFNAVGNKKEYVRALQLGMLWWLALAVLFGLAGYYIFGSSAAVIIIDNLGWDIHLRPHRVPFLATVLLQFLMLLHCQLKMVPSSRPILELLIQTIGITVDVADGGFQSSLAGLPVFVVVAVAAYSAIDSMSLVDSLCGSMLMSSNAFVLPSIAFIVICHPRGIVRRCSMATCVFGCVLALVVPGQYLWSYLSS